MAKKEIAKKAHWALAKRQADRMGVVLTRRKNSKGEYVCYLKRGAGMGLLVDLWKDNERREYE